MCVFDRAFPLQCHPISGVCLMECSFVRIDAARFCCLIIWEFKFSLLFIPGKIKIIEQQWSLSSARKNDGSLFITANVLCNSNFIILSSHRHWSTDVGKGTELFQTKTRNRFSNAHSTFHWWIYYVNDGTRAHRNNIMICEWRDDLTMNNACFRFVLCPISE